MSNPHPTHPVLAKNFNRDEGRTDWHDSTLWAVRTKRDKQAATVPEWEKLRETASQIKQHMLSNLHDYLLEFEANLQRNGITVHWAADGAEHNRIVLDILKEHNIRQAVKSKSMLTQECGLNEYLEENGVEIIDTDLGERIVQLAKEPPSHIVMPCIHKRKEEIGALFHAHMGVEQGITDPDTLVAVAREHLREVFLTRRAALTGVNFAVAETGEFVVCTNEGNADMGAHLSDVHIACMGIEKMIPKRENLGVFLRLLARSATGQPITVYSSHYRKPRKGQQMHVILVDNGRSARLANPDFSTSLKCIRCAACMNTCPVYRKSGGHSYHSDAIAGPIGAILTPNTDLKAYADLPFASTLCGSCSNVCPVKIDIHQQLYRWRQVIVQAGHVSPAKKVGMQLMSSVLSQPSRLRSAGKAGRWFISHVPVLVNNRFNGWYKQREMPAVPKQSFHEWYKKRKK